MWEPPKCPRPCFDLHFDRSSRPKNPSKTCALQGPPQHSCGSIFFYICSIASHRTLLLSLSINLQQLKKLCCWKKEAVITFSELRIQKRVRSGLKKWARNSDPFLVPLSIGIFPESSIKLIFGIAQSGRGATISSATCSWRTKCSQLMLALNTYSFQTIKLKLAAFLPSAAPTGEALCSAHVFEGFLVSKMGP